MTKKQADKYIEHMDNWCNKEKALHMIPSVQAEIYVMCGMGYLGTMGACQPSDFYIDTRCGRLPYNKISIKSIARILARLIEIAELEEPLEFNTYNHIGV